MYVNRKADANFNNLGITLCCYIILIYVFNFVGLGVCEFVFWYMYLYVYVFINTFNKISSTDTSSKQLYMTCGYININKKNQTNVLSDGWWNLNSFAGELEQKSLS